MTNINKLRAKMCEAGDYYIVTKLAELLKISRQTASKLLKNEREFSQTEINMLKNYYQMSSEEITEIFLKDE